jgi:hypothetical protein
MDRLYTLFCKGHNYVRNIFMKLTLGVKFKNIEHMKIKTASKNQCILKTLHIMKSALNGQRDQLILKGP